MLNKNFRSSLKYVQKIGFWWVIQSTTADISPYLYHLRSWQKVLLTMEKREKTVSNANYMMMVISDVCAVPTKQEKGFRSTGAGTGSYESPYGCWELHLSSPWIITLSSQKTTTKSKSCHRDRVLARTDRWKTLASDINRLPFVWIVYKSLQNGYTTKGIILILIVMGKIDRFQKCQHITDPPSLLRTSPWNTTDAKSLKHFTKTVLCFSENLSHTSCLDYLQCLRKYTF